jgi:MSHA biogenesis protein MshP
MAAIAVLVVLAVLAAFIVSFSSLQHLDAAQDVLGSRAYWAAQAGLEWGLTRASAETSLSAACPTTASTLAVDSFSVSVACTYNSYDEAGATATVIRVEATANLGTVGTSNYVERVVVAMLEK